MASRQIDNPGGSKPNAPQRKAVVEDTMLLNSVQSYFKKAAVVLAVWATGYFKFSPSWLLLGLVVYVWKEKKQAKKKNSIAIAQAIARDEKGVILARVEDLPAWVFFPDVERAEWVNKMIDQLWPYIGVYVRKLLQESIEPKIRASLPATFSSFKFTNIDLGDIPPRIGGVKVYTSEVRRDEIYMDLEINYASDSDIAVYVKGMNFGIKEFTLRGSMRIIFRPLITKVPLIGGMNVFFLNNPEVDFNLTSLANAFDLPGLSDMLHNIVQEQIANIMVLPNRIPIQMASDVDIKKLRYPMPQGVLRVHVVEARDLKKADISITGKGKSDPYTIVTVGAQTFKTKVIDDTVEPVWNEVFEFIIDERDGQMLKLDLNDKDPGNKDDPLGSTTVDISIIFEKGSVDEWLPLEDVKKGMVHIRATWLYLANDPLELDRVMMKVREEGIDEDSVHSALLVVNLDSALDLPRGKKTLLEPWPYVVLTLGQTSKESKVRNSTTEPRWEENFRFFVANPNHQNLDVEVRDSKTKNKVIGEATIRLKELMNAEEMVLDQKFPLKTEEPNSSIYMTVGLRVLTPEANPEWMESENLLKDTPAEGKESSVDTPSADVDSKAGGAAQTAPSGGGDPPSGAEKKGTAPSGPQEEVIKPASSATPSESNVRQRKAVADEDGEFNLGRIQITFRYSATRKNLIVVIHKIANLKPAQGDSKGLADPYIKLCLLPERDSKNKRKTNIIDNNLNPVFDETFEFAVNMSELSQRTLEVSVRNDVGMFSSSQKFLGMALIELQGLDPSRAVTQWVDLAPQDSVRTVPLE
ncbi:hypothetical protein ACOMHN_035743 [Nucella lapillus]